MSFSRMPAASLIGIIMAGCAASGPHPREERDFLFAGRVCRRCSNCGPLRRGVLLPSASVVLPAPDLSLAAMGTRVEAVCVGFLVATGLFWAAQFASRPFPRRKQKNDRRDPGGYFFQMPSSMPRLRSYSIPQYFVISPSIRYANSSMAITLAAKKNSRSDSACSKKPKP